MSALESPSDEALRAASPGTDAAQLIVGVELLGQDANDVDLFVFRHGKIDKNLEIPEQQQGRTVEKIECDAQRENRINVSCHAIHTRYRQEHAQCQCNDHKPIEPKRNPKIHHIGLDEWTVELS